MSRYPRFDRSRLEVLPLAERDHDLDLSCFQDLAPREVVHPSLAEVARRIRTARDRGASVLWMMGAHVLRRGVQRFLVDCLERGWISGIALNGAGIIHDYELALVGATTESVARYIRDGRFGLWQETGELNEVIREGDAAGLGLGEAVGRYLVESQPPHLDASVVAAAYRCGIPVTVHVGLGHDILHEHPSCDGGATGSASYRDFLIFTKLLEDLEGGVVMNFGSAIMAPEVYLKALAMVRNLARQEGRSIAAFTTLVCDLQHLPEDLDQEPPRNHPAYYYRPLKTMLLRTVADGGESFYVRGDHAETVPQLWTALTRPEEEERP